MSVMKKMFTRKNEHFSFILNHPTIPERTISGSFHGDKPHNGFVIREPHSGRKQHMINTTLIWRERLKSFPAQIVVWCKLSAY